MRIQNRSESGGCNGNRNKSDTRPQYYLLIFDLAQERPNVYYELGFAHGVRNEATDILLIPQRGTVPHLDVAPLRVQYFSTETELRRVVAEQLKRMIIATRRTS